MKEIVLPLLSAASIGAAQPYSCPLRVGNQTPSSTRGLGSILMRLFLLAVSVPLFAAAEYLPLHPGNAWTYREAGGRKEFTIAVGLTQIMFDGNVYHSLTGYVNGRVYVRYNDRGDLVYRDEDRNADILLTSFGSGGLSFEAPLRACPANAEIADSREPIEGPSGWFSQALLIRYRLLACADIGVLEEQFVDNVGLVARTVQTIAGPRRYELVSAQAGGVSVIERGGTGFRVSVKEVQPDRVTLVLRLTNRTGEAMQLVFPTSQEYDAALYDSNGTEIALWSAGSAFAQALHERYVGNELSFSVDLPLVGPLAPGKYNIFAWLTSGPGRHSPEFSARAEFQVRDAAVPAPSVCPGERCVGTQTR